MQHFDVEDLKKLYKPASASNGEDNGQITIIGGSTLFQGAPILSLKSASRIVDMVFFASPEPSIGEIATELKSKLNSFIWVPWEDAHDYMAKSDALLIGPGFMRFGRERTPEHLRIHSHHNEGKASREITKDLLERFPNKKWVIDAGSLQVMEPEWIPENAIITPNKKEFCNLFKLEASELMEESLLELVKEYAQRYACIIVYKAPTAIVSDGKTSVLIGNGNAGLTKGGTGDVLAGLTTALLAKNEPFLAASAASFILKNAADELFQRVGFMYSADDLADYIPELSKKLQN